MNPLNPHRNTRRDIVSRKTWLLAPHGLVACTWLVYIIFFVGISPVQYHRPLSGAVIIFLATCLLAFGCGSMLGLGRSRNRLTLSGQGSLYKRPAYTVIDKVTRTCAILGILGACLVVIDKVFVGGLDLTSGLGNLRMEHNVESVFAKRRSPILFVGMATYSFSNVALVIYVLAGEACRRSTGALVCIASTAPTIVVLLYGGRSSSILLMIYFFCAGLVRKAAGQQFLPRAPFVRPLWVVYCSLVIAGSLYIFTSRAESRGHNSSLALMHGFNETTDAFLSRDLEKAISRDGALGSLFANLIMAAGYVTHGLPELDYLLNDNREAGPYYGCHQLWIMGKTISAIAGLPDPTVDMEIDIHHSGLFFTAWGEMLLDFGISGSVAVLLLLGVVSGRLYDQATRSGSIISSIFLTHIFTYVVMSPIHSAFSTGNSMQVLASIAVVSIMLRRGMSGMSKQPLRARLRPAIGHPPRRSLRRVAS